MRVSALVAIASFDVARAGLAAEQQADEPQCVVEPHGLAAVTGDDPREALAEDALGTEAVAAAEAAGAQFQLDGHAVPGEVGDVARLIAVNARRETLASWALSLGACDPDD
jgi:hypothetical protein